MEAVNLGQAFDVTGVAFTICFRIRVDGPNDTQGGRILAKRDGGTGWELVVPRWNGPISFCSAVSHVNVGSTRVDDGQWHHCAVVYDGDVMRCYVDGNFDGQHSFGAIQPAPLVDLWIGSRGENDKLIGEFKELFIFNRIFSPEEIDTFAATTGPNAGDDFVSSRLNLKASLEYAAAHTADPSTHANIAVGKPLTIEGLSAAFNRDPKRLVDGHLGAPDHWGTQDKQGSITIDLEGTHDVFGVDIFWSGSWVSNCSLLMVRCSTRL